jgi:hypothetical protein
MTDLVSIAGQAFQCVMTDSCFRIYNVLRQSTRRDPKHLADCGPSRSRSPLHEPTPMRVVRQNLALGQQGSYAGFQLLQIRFTLIPTDDTTIRIDQVT